MKTSKSPIAQPYAFDQSAEHKSVDDSDLSKYLKQIAYWVGQVLFEFNRLETALTAVIGERINGANVRGYEYVFLTGLTYAHKVELLQRIYRYQITLALVHEYFSSHSEPRFSEIWTVFSHKQP